MIKEILLGAKNLSFLSIVIRSIILYISVIAATRLMGKRQVGIISGHNYLVAAGIVSLVAVRMVNPNTSLISGLVIVFTYALINRLWSYLDLKIPNMIDRKPKVLIDNGQILFNNLRKAQLPISDLLMGLRQKKVWNLNIIHQAILEPTGEISVQKKTPYSSVTEKDMGITPNTISQLPKLIYKSDRKSFSPGTLSKYGIKLSNDTDIQGIVINSDNSFTMIKKG